MSSFAAKVGERKQPVAGLRVQEAAGLAVLLGAVALAVIMSKTEAALATLWFLGIAAGFTLQRSRFCFASAFRDVFLFGNSHIMKGILVGLGVGTLGFAIVMYGYVPRASFGNFPPEAHILPVGLSAITGGLLFGFGMVLSGGCVSGSLYRMAEGYVASWVSVGGVVVGLGLLTHTWNWWWLALIQFEPKVWLPAKLGLGYGGAVTITLVGLLGVFLLLTWWEARSGISMAVAPEKAEPQDTFAQKVGHVWRRVFVLGWPAVVGGGVLGGIGVLMYMVHMPFGVIGELSRWANAAMSAVGIPAPELLGLSGLGGCTARAGEPGLFTHTFAVTVGVLAGSLVAALFAREFKLRYPRSAVRYAQSLGGGVVMGYGAGLAIGCTIGAFFSAIPSLSLSGWLFALALAGGAFAGVQVIKRIP